MVDIAILCPIEEEFTAVRKLILHASPHISELHKLPFEFGWLPTAVGNWSVALIEPGSKHNNFELRTYQVLHELRPKYVFLVGVAGGRKEVRIGDIVVSTKAYDYEPGKETSQGFVSRPDSVHNDSEDLLTLARRLARYLHDQPSFSDYKVHFGPIASGNKIIASTQANTYKIIEGHYENTLAVELEAYGFARMASHFKVKYLNIRGISDLIDDKAQADAQGSQSLSAARAANFLFQLIQRLPIPNTTQMQEMVPIKYCEKKYRLYEMRNPQDAILLFRKDRIEFKSEEKAFQLFHIHGLKHISMAGDFSKTWVELRFWQNQQIVTLYFSSLYTVPGWRYWIGGSRSLFRRLQSFQVRDTPTIPLYSESSLIEANKVLDL